MTAIGAVWAAFADDCGARTPAADVSGEPLAAALTFRLEDDPWSEPTIWSADPDRPAVLLQRHQIPLDDLGDALWQLIVRAVEGMAR